MKTGLSNFCKGVVAVCIPIFTLSGCDIKDGLDNGHCPAFLNLRFVYTLNTDYVDKFAQQVEHTDLFFYDQDENLVQTTRIATADMADALPEGKSIELSVAAGKYTVVAWSNLNDADYKLIAADTKGGMRVAVNTFGNQLDVKQASLFHGVITELDIKPNKNVSGLFEMVKDVNDIQVILHQVPPPKVRSDAVPIHRLEPIDFSEYEVAITGSNMQYEFNNNRCSQSVFCTYKPWYGYTPWSEDPTLPPGVTTHMRVMRLFTGDDLSFVVYKNGAVVHSEPLTEYILNSHADCNIDEDLDRRDSYVVKIPFTMLDNGEIFIGGGDLNGGDGNGAGGGGDLNGDGNGNANGGGDIHGGGGANGGGNAGNIGSGGDLSGK